MTPSGKTLWQPWLARLRHDLVKRLMWAARDRRDMGGVVRRGELRAALVDDEGRPTTATALWAALVAGAPVPGHPALAVFAQEVTQAEAAAARDDLAGVLELQGAFERLARIVNAAGSEG